jgi:hypothetical protein
MSGRQVALKIAQMGRGCCEKLSQADSAGETPQPAATGVHSMAGMGQSRLGATSNSNSLGNHSDLEQAHEARGDRRP